MFSSLLTASQLFSSLLCSSELFFKLFSVSPLYTACLNSASSLHRSSHVRSSQLISSQLIQLISALLRFSMVFSTLLSSCLLFAASVISSHVFSSLLSSSQIFSAHLMSFHLFYPPLSSSQLVSGPEPASKPDPGAKAAQSIYKFEAFKGRVKGNKNKKHQQKTHCRNRATISREASLKK